MIRVVMADGDRERQRERERKLKLTEKEEEAKSVVGVTQEQRSAGIREVALCACILDNGILRWCHGILFLPAFYSLLFSMEY